MIGRFCGEEESNEQEQKLELKVWVNKECCFVSDCRLLQSSALVAQSHSFCMMHFYGIIVNERVNICYKFDMAEGPNEHFHRLQDLGVKFKTGLYTYIIYS